MPESPRWLVANGREDEAAVILSRCYAEGTDTNELVDSIRRAVTEEQQANGTMSWYKMLCRPTPGVRRMLLVGVGVAAAQQTTAIEAVQYYVLYILESAGVEDKGTAFMYLLGLGLLKVVVIVLAGRLFDHPKVGRRPLLLASNAGIALALVILAINFSMGEPSVGWAVLALALFVCFFSLGMGPGCWLIASEVFSTQIRARAMSLATFTNRGCAVIIGSTFLTLRSALGDSGFFMLFVVLVMGNIAFIYRYVPETKGRTLEDMLRYFDEVTANESVRVVRSNSDGDGDGLVLVAHDSQSNPLQLTSGSAKDSESNGRREEARRQEGTTTSTIGDEGGCGVAVSGGGNFDDDGGMSDVALDA
mmetsp:Transcript_93898/g.268895  ORF Transcript_93898/g.268895 Transcript_93898/m.268895 type:complete len:362 (+) Transcript_93898:123-1208(+)